MTTPETDRFLSEVARLISIATSVINEHVNDQGLCAVCDSAWPCERALLAEHNLAALTP
jgi:hypothetical protein